MAIDIRYFRAIQQSINSPSPSETRRRIAVQGVKKDFHKSLDVDKFLLWNKQITDEEVFLNVHDRELSTVIGEKQSFTCFNDAPISTGDIVYNPIQNEYWIVRFSKPVDYIYKSGILWLCSYILKWQDEAGNIWEYPVHDTNTTQYNSGIEFGRNIDYISSQHKLTTTADKNTLSIPIDKRIFLGNNILIPDVFTVTQNDTTSLHYGKGLTAITVLRSVFNPETDDIATRLCDTKKRIDDISTSHEGTINICYKGTSNIIVGRNKTLFADTSEIITDWRVEESDLSEFVSISVNADKPNECFVSIEINDKSIKAIGQTFTIICTDIKGNVGKQSFGITGGV